MTRDRNRYGPHIPPAAPAGSILTDALALVLAIVLGALIVALVWAL